MGGGGGARQLAGGAGLLEVMVGVGGGDGGRVIGRRLGSNAVRWEGKDGCGRGS